MLCNLLVTVSDQARRLTCDWTFLKVDQPGDVLDQERPLGASLPEVDLGQVDQFGVEVEEKSWREIGKSR